jgi:hypothetical protein
VRCIQEQVPHLPSTSTPTPTKHRAIAGLSKAGFSGFTEGGAEGRTVISGRVISVTPDSITVEGQGGQRSTLRLSGQGQPRRLEAASKEAIRPGVTVIVRRDPGSDVAKAVLVISNKDGVAEQQFESFRHR